MSENNKRPYVISGELDLSDPNIIDMNALDGWREDLDNTLRGMGKNTLWVPSDEIRRGMLGRLNNAGLPVVSLDDRYVKGENDFYYIGVSRGADNEYVARVGYPPIEEQLARIANLGEVVIADDVVFSGDMMEWLAGELKKWGTTIAGVICGIAIGEGAEKLEAAGIGVDPVLIFDEVDDELCERDLVVVPGSGRRMPGGNVLYFDPDKGNPTKWASIPALYVRKFGAEAYRLSAELLKPGVRLGDEGIGSFIGLPAQGLAGPALLERASVIEAGGNNA